MRWARSFTLIALLALITFLWPSYPRAVLLVVAETAPYLLVGFWLAGLLKSLIPEHTIYRHLGGDTLGAVVRASFFGIPLPLCSCSVLPLAAALRRGGASQGATTSFLISTPETGLDSIGVTYALLDPIMTIVRPLSAFLTALCTGVLVNGWVRLRRETAVPMATSPVVAVASGGETHTHATASCIATRGTSRTDQHSHATSCCEPAIPTASTRHTPWHILRTANAYAFGPLLDDLTPWLILGFLLSGVVAVAMPEDFFGTVIPTGWGSSLLMLVLGTPMYICAASATPLAAALIAKGLDPGAALVFLLVGPATNVTTVLVISRLLGRPVLALYLFGVTGCALLLGRAVNALYAALQINLATYVSGLGQEQISGVAAAATLLLLLLLGRSVVRLRLLG